MSTISITLHKVRCIFLIKIREKLGKQDFDNKLAKAFESLERARSEGKIKHYGLSSWQAFRVAEDHPAHLSLHSVMRIAEKVGGKSHGLRFIQLPVHL